MKLLNLIWFIVKDKKKIWPIIFLSLLFIWFIGFIYYKNIDIWINTKYVVQKNFQDAFLHRTTWNCEIFLNYLYFYNSLHQNCINEKNWTSKSIYTYKIINLTIDNGNIAYLQVLLNRGFSNQQNYVTNYQMAKINNKWYLIDNNSLYAVKLFNAYKISQDSLDSEVNKIKTNDKLSNLDRYNIKTIFDILVKDFNR